MLTNAARRRMFRQRMLTRNNRGQPGALHITLSFRTIQKILQFLSPAASSGPRQQAPALRPTLRPWVAVIDQIIKEDAALPKKLQTTATRIVQKLREEHGYTGCYNVVQEYVHEARTAASHRKRSAAESKKKKHHAELAKPLQKMDLPTAPSPQEKRAIPRPLPPPSSYGSSRRSLEEQTSSSRDRLFQRYHPSQRNHETEEQVFEWMQGVQQGAIPSAVLAKELSNVPLAEVEALRSAAAKGDLSQRNKAVGILGYLRGIRATPISSFLHVTEGCVFKWWRLFRKGGAKTLLTRKQRSDVKANKDSIKQAVFALLHSPPASHGFNRTTWKIADLKTVLSEDGFRPISPQVTRTVIKEAGWKWRHARIVLTSNDPDYRAKVDTIKKILSELKVGEEAFFSIDEFGPFAVKQKGGVKRVAPGDQYIVRQWQKSKGWLILTAALELSTNQVSHFYSRKKDTAEMIKMADLLRSQYHTYRTLYLSWDAASWHLSKELAAHLEKINQEALAEGFPIIKTAPLPACAQFLNVIESVFSGMAKAIIHNSDYPSTEAAIEAIECYFGERNEYFSEHPRRAGKKLWGMERVPSMFAEDQNCKDPMYQYPMGG